MSSVVRVKQILGKVDVDLKCDICNISERILSEAWNCISYEEQYAGGEFLEQFALLCQFNPSC